MKIHKEFDLLSFNIFYCCEFINISIINHLFDFQHSAPSPSSFADFSELLELVSVIPLCDIDDKLTPFMNLNISWYITLAPVLKTRYPDSHREYKSSDGNSIYVVSIVILLIRASFMFILRLYYYFYFLC